MNQIFLEKKPKKLKFRMNLNNKIMNELIIRKIENLRKTKLLTQEHLAQKIGMSKNGYNNIVINKDFKFSTLEKIAEVLDVPVSYFFEEDEKGYDSKNMESNKASDNEAIYYTKKTTDEKIEQLKEQIEELKKIIEEKNTTIAQKDNFIEKLMMFHK